MVNIPLFTWFHIHPRWLFGISEPSVAEPARVETCRWGSVSAQFGPSDLKAWNLDIVKIPIKHTIKKSVFFPPKKKIINCQLQKRCLFFLIKWIKMAIS